MDDVEDGIYIDDSSDSDSDESVAGATETSISQSHYSDTLASRSSAGAGSVPEDKRMGALTHTLAEKQHGISETFCLMIEKLTKMVQQMEAQQAAGDAKSKSKARRSNAEKALEMQEAARAMAAKQARISQQFEALVQRIESEFNSAGRDNQSLRRQVQMARVILKDEAGVEMEDLSVMTPSSSHYNAAPGRAGPAARHHNHHPPPTTTPRSPSHNKLPPRSGSHRSKGSGRFASLADKIHPIREIAFSNTVVDVAEMSSSVPDPAPLATAESNSSSEHSPATKATAATSISAATTSPASTATTNGAATQTAADNLRLLL